MMKNPEYRLVRKTERFEDRIDYHFVVCQVFYNNDGEIKLIDTADIIRGRSPESAETLYNSMGEAFSKPTLDFDSLKELGEVFCEY